MPKLAAATYEDIRLQKDEERNGLNNARKWAYRY